MVNFKTKDDGIVHLQANDIQHEQWMGTLIMADPPDVTACGLFLVTKDVSRHDIMMEWGLGWQRADASDERATCLGCIGA